MSKKLLTKIITELVNGHAEDMEYGVSLINIPEFDYVSFVQGLNSSRRLELFFLGFSAETQAKLVAILPQLKNLSYRYTVEAAESSRNSGNEDVFRILIVKHSELEKLSSLRWFNEITLTTLYAYGCKYVKDTLKNSNSVIESLILALKRKTVQNMLSFERVIEYLENLVDANPAELPSVLKEKYYMLGLCHDKSIDSGNPTTDDFVARIKRNHAIVERVGNLERTERQSITNYYSKSTSNKDIPRLILRYYKTRNVEFLKEMELEEVEECLKAVKENSTPVTPRKPKRPKTITVKPTAMAAQLIFDDAPQKIDDIIEELESKVDRRQNLNKSERVDIDVDNTKMQFKAEPTTEIIATMLATEDTYGTVVYANVQTPDEAIKNKAKYESLDLNRDYLDVVWENLSRIGSMLSDGESISAQLKDFLKKRAVLIPYRQRLQDVPMLQVLARYEEFAKYIKAYEKLLTAINDDFPKIWQIAPSNAKAIINTVMSLDYVFIVGESEHHAIPTPLNPMYLWKYVELAKEILSSKGVNETEEAYLDENDKAFIVRKAEDIPDPLSVILLPSTITNANASFLPLAGRLGSLPIYSTKKQINQSESGIDALKEAIMRYLCLYPHAGMMLKLTVVDPPSVETIVSMLKLLNSDKDFNINGIEISVYRTKEASDDWMEIGDDSLNDGMLGKYRGKRSFNFKLRIIDQRKNYSKILDDLSQEQHMLIIFDPNEVKVETAQNNRRIHIHPLCVPKIYKYNPIENNVEIRPASEGSIFSIYSSIIEKLNEHPSAFSHTATFFHTPLKIETYDAFLKKADWLIILDQSLKTWDVSLRAASEKLFYRENDYRSIGIYSSNCKKFILGYETLIKGLGNYIPNADGVKEIIQSIREINDDGLLSIASHKSNRIFDTNHGKGSLGIAVSAIHYKRKYPNALLVGLDTQLAKEWLSERDERTLPDLIGLRLNPETDEAIIDIIEVKTYSNNDRSFRIEGNEIWGHAVEQASVLESLAKEIFGATERITTVSRREILREQVFEALFQSDMIPESKLKYSEMLNELFAGSFRIEINKSIAFVDFENAESCAKTYVGRDSYAGNKYRLDTIGSDEIRAIISNSEFIPSVETQGGEAMAISLEVIPEQSEEIVRETEIVVTEKAVTSVITESVTPSVVTDPSASIASIVREDSSAEKQAQRKAIEEKCIKLNKVFKDYGINAYPINPEIVQEAARFTRFPVELKSGETVRSLERYKTDIGIQLEANGEILIDHIKGTKYISVDVPFVHSGKTISLLDHLSLTSSKEGALNIVAGQKPDGKFEVMDISKAPHMLVAGTTGSGKTIFLYSILVSLLDQYSADELEVLIIDPKQTDFIFFEGVPHLYGGHIVKAADEALEMLQRINAVDKEERTTALMTCRSRDIESYNQKNPNDKMKRLVVVIDEYSDLIQAAEMQGNRKEFEKNLQMLLQRVRNLGIHLIIATQRPSAQIVTGALKAVIPFRVSFRLPSHTDSQTILDKSGAETLLGKGDMLMVTDSDTMRMQGLYISEDELSHFIEKLL